MVLKEPILCKSSMLFLRHFIFAQLLKEWWLVFIVFVFVSNARFNIDAMHRVAGEISPK